MTLIANTLNYSYPIIVGDILMSSEQIKKNISLPTFLKGVDNLLPSDQKFFPYSLRQKIYVITDNLAIALAGSEFQIKLFLEDIKLNFHFKQSTAENIEKFFNEYDFSNFDESACLLLYTDMTVDGILINQKIRGPWREEKSQSFEHVFACGSGSKYYLEDALKNNHYGNWGDNNPLYKAISLNYINLCNLLSVERLSLDTIRQAWGAGFEMIYFNGTRFEKMDDVTFIIWKGKVDLSSENHQVEPFLALNFKYYNDILAISATDFNTIEGYGVLPLTMRKQDFDVSLLPTKPHFNTRKICCSYVLELSNGKIFTPAFFAESKEFPGTVSIDFNNEGQLEIMVNKEVEDFVMESVRQLVRDYKIN